MEAILYQQQEQQRQLLADMHSNIDEDNFDFNDIRQRHTVHALLNCFLAFSDGNCWLARFRLLLCDLLPEYQEFLLTRLDFRPPHRHAAISNQPKTFIFGFSTSKIGAPKFSLAYIDPPTSMRKSKKTAKKPPTLHQNVEMTPPQKNAHTYFCYYTPLPLNLANNKQQATSNKQASNTSPFRFGHCSVPTLRALHYSSHPTA